MTLLGEDQDQTLITCNRFTFEDDKNHLYDIEKSISCTHVGHTLHNKNHIFIHMISFYNSCVIEVSVLLIILSSMFMNELWSAEKSRVDLNYKIQV